MRNVIAKVSNIALHKKRPASLVHFITNRCNARCGHCFIDFDDKESQKASMKLADIEKLSKSLGPQIMNINLTGGEPFLSADIAAIATAYFTNSAIDSIYITTHGGLTDRVKAFVQEIAPRFSDRKLIFSISIDHLGERHNEARKVPNLFDDALRTYDFLKAYGRNVIPNVSITVSGTNCDDMDTIVDALVMEHGVTSLTSNIVRDEGVYIIPPHEKERILAGYLRLNSRIASSGELSGYDPGTLLGRMMNHKEAEVVRQIGEVYLEPRYVLPCRAGALLGIIYPNGDVYPCEILENRPMGNLHDHDFDLMSLWDTAQSEELRTWIRDTECNCTFECAWSFNVLGSPRHQPGLALAALGRK